MSSAEKPAALGEPRGDLGIYSGFWDLSRYCIAFFPLRLVVLSLRDLGRGIQSLKFSFVVSGHCILLFVSLNSIRS